MSDGAAIRPGGPADLPALERLYRAAFPQEELRPLVRDLLAQASPVLSFVAPGGAEVGGHVAVTPCGVEGTPAVVALLGPLAVAPAAQRRGIGSALVRHALAALRDTAAVRALVLGDPAYYGRFGFRAETGIAAPYPLPAAWRDAWQGLALAEAAPAPRGVLRVPPPWRRPELWAP
jgi:putative acetyltransferase